MPFTTASARTVILIILASASLARAACPANQPALRVNGVTLDGATLGSCATQERANTFSAFVEQGARVTPTFWTTITGQPPKRPLDVLADRAARRCTDQTILRAHGVRLGLFQDTLDASFDRRWHAEVQRRRDASARSKVVYGPVLLPRDAYRDLELQNLSTRLQMVWFPSAPAEQARRDTDARLREEQLAARATRLASFQSCVRSAATGDTA